MKIPERILQKIRPPVAPFERRDFRLEVKENEDLMIPSITINSAKLPAIVKVLNHEKYEENRKTKSLFGKYLWLIDEENGLRIIEENTPAPSERGIVCHTNISGGKKALQGGELWFCDNGLVYLNYRSGRYGASTADDLQEKHQEGVVEYFEYLGFTVESVD